MKNNSISRFLATTLLLTVPIGFGSVRLYAQTATGKAPVASPMVIPSSAKWTKGGVNAVAAEGKRVYGRFWSDKNMKWKEWFWTPGKGFVEGNTLSLDQVYHSEPRPIDIVRKKKVEDWNQKFGKSGISFPKAVGIHKVVNIYARSISDDSKVVIGTYVNMEMGNTAYGKMFLWTEKQGFQDLTDFALLDEKRYGILNDFSAAVSPDGSVVVVGTNYVDITIIKL